MDDGKRMVYIVTDGRTGKGILSSRRKARWINREMGPCRMIFILVETEEKKDGRLVAKATGVIRR